MSQSVSLNFAVEAGAVKAGVPQLLAQTRVILEEMFLVAYQHFLGPFEVNLYFLPNFRAPFFGY